MASESESEKRSDADTVTLCGGGCDGCPDAHFLPDGSVLLTDLGQAVLITAPQLAHLFNACRARGLPRCPTGSSS